MKLNLNRILSIQGAHSQLRSRGLLELPRILASGSPEESKPGLRVSQGQRLPRRRQESPGLPKVQIRKMSSGRYGPGRRSDGAATAVPVSESHRAKKSVEKFGKARRELLGFESGEKRRVGSFEA